MLNLDRRGDVFPKFVPPRLHSQEVGRMLSLEGGSYQLDTVLVFFWLHELLRSTDSTVLGRREILHERGRGSLGAHPMFEHEVLTLVNGVQVHL